MERVLITGSGLLANSLSTRFSNSECFLTYRKNRPEIDNSIFLDITKSDELQKVIFKLKPDIIIHTAAITDLDWSEKNQSDTFNVNTQAVQEITNLAKKINFASLCIKFVDYFNNYKKFMNLIEYEDLIKII